MENAEAGRIDAAVDGWLERLASDAESRSGVSVRELLGMSVGRVIKRELAGNGTLGLDGNVRRIRERYESGTLHVRDWLVGAVLRHDTWLTRVNSEGVPLKLAKSGHFDQIVDEANKAMRKLASRGVEAKLSSDVVHVFGNGYTMVQLKTPAELEAESSMMQHCVGQGAYHGAVESGQTEIYSLRDAHGKAHVTIEIDAQANTVEQVKGKQNDIPRADYFEMVAEWLNTRDYKFDCDDYPMGFAVDNDGKFVNITKLEDGTRFDGDLKIDLTDSTVMPSLPRNLTVTGSLSIWAPGMVPTRRIAALPKGLVVLGDFVMRGILVSQDEEFPGRAVYLERCVVENLPPRVAQTTTMWGCTVVGDFPDGVVFERLLAISSSTLTHSRLLDRSEFKHSLNLDSISALTIPDGLKVAGDLKITRSPGVFFDGSVEVGQSMVVNDSRIEGDPNRIRVGTTLHVHRSKMRMLPDDTVVGGDLVLSGVTDIRALSRAVKVGGDIRIDDTQIETLDGRTDFDADLWLHRTSVRELGTGTVVRGHLTISHLPMERLPPGLIVTGDLRVGPCPVKRIPRSTRIGGSLDLSESYVVAVPEGFNIPGNLDISFTGCFRIPEGVSIGGSLIARQSGIERLPNRLSVYSLLASGSALERLPCGLVVKGDLDVRGATRIESIPPSLSVGGSADFRETAVEFVPASVYVGGELYVEDGVVMEAACTPSPSTGARYG